MSYHPHAPPPAVPPPTAVPVSVAMPPPPTNGNGVQHPRVITTNGGTPMSAASSSAGSVASGPKKHRHEDEEQGKLFVGGLSWDTNQESLLRYFGRYGEVIDCVVMKNPETGRSRGFGFVTFSDPNNIDAVIASGPHSLDGRTIDPKSCNPRSMQKPKKGATGQQYPKVFLGGLPTAITETDLRSFFTRYGEVIEVVIMYDQEKKKSRGFGFLSFGDEGACGRAVAEHFVNIQNKQVEIKRAEPRTNPPPPSMGSSEISTASSASSMKDQQAQAQPPQQVHQHPQAPPPQQVDQWGTPIPPHGIPNGHPAHPPPHHHHHPHGQPPPSHVQHHQPAASPYPAWGATLVQTAVATNGPPPQVAGPPPPPAGYHAPYGAPPSTAAAPAPQWVTSPAANGPPPQWGVHPAAPGATTYASPPPAGQPGPPPHATAAHPPTQYPPPTAQAPPSTVYAPVTPSTPQPPPAGAPPQGYWGQPAVTVAPAPVVATDPYSGAKAGEYSYPGAVTIPNSYSYAGAAKPADPTYTNSSAGSYYQPAPSPVAAVPPPPHGYAAAPAPMTAVPPAPVTAEVVGGPQRGTVSYGAQPPPYHPYRRS